MQLSTTPRAPAAYLPPSSPDPPSDELLVARMSGGDTTALGTLYDRHWTTVYSLAYAITRSVSDAEDVAAGTFEQLWRNAARFDPARGTVPMWVTIIARSRALDVLRARRRRDHLHARAANHIGEEAGHAADCAAFDPPDVVVERRELAAAVRASLAAIPPMQRRAIELAFFEGLSHTAVAQALGEPLGTVKSRIRAGMHRLRAVLRE